MRTPERGRRECFRRLRRIAHHKAGVRVRQVKSEEVDLALRATDDADRFPEVGLCMPRRMHQRYEHLLRSLPPAGHVILHDRDPAREAVLISQPLENPLRRMLLLFGRDLSSSRMRSITEINGSS